MSKTICVIEDDVPILDSLCEVLSSTGYAVEGHHDAREALRCLKTPRRRVDLIVLDLMMPGLSGWDFRTLQKADPELRSIPVLAISADTSSKAAAIDAVKFLPKPLRVLDVLTAVQSIFCDLESQRMRARLHEAERLASLGTLAAGVGHEIRNPLQFTMHNLELIGTKASDVSRVIDQLETSTGPALRSQAASLREPLREIAELVRTCSIGTERIRLVVSALQGLARKPEGQQGRVDPHDVLEESIAMAWSQIRHRAQLVRRFEAVGQLWADRARIGQLFLNIILNATQAIPEGRQEDNQITITTHTDSGMVVVEIRDTGVGIPEEIRERMFDPFFTTKPVDEGTGLGLSVCYSVVREHGGELEVESEAGEGSLFRIRLPVQQQAAEPSVEPGPADSTETVERRRVLVVEDEPLVARVMQQMLAPYHDTVVSMRGSEALEILSADDAFDAILCDLMMPNMTGIQFLDKLEEQHPHLARRIVFVTGGLPSGRAEQVMREQQIPLLSKPFRPQALIEVIRRITKKPELE